MWTDSLHDCHINLQDWQDIELAQLLIFFPGTGNLISGSNRIPGSRQTAASATKALPNTRSEVSGKFKLSQLSTLQRRLSPLIWPFGNYGNWEGNDHWLAPACACSFCSVLVIDVNWPPAWTPHQLARLFSSWTSTSACMLPAWRKLFKALLILSRNRNRQRASWSIRDSWKPSHSSISNQGSFQNKLCPFFGTVDRYELECCMTATSICKTGKTLN